MRRLDDSSMTPSGRSDVNGNEIDKLPHRTIFLTIATEADNDLKSLNKKIDAIDNSVLDRKGCDP
jgi:hypothetical protein